jgi:methyl-accepting chemotaxis protein
MGLTTQKQYRTLLYVNTLGIVLIGGAVAGWGVFALFPAHLGEGYHSSLAIVQVIRKVLFWRVAVLYGVILLLMIVSMAALHLLYSHRIAGPAYRIGCEAEKIARGDLTGTVVLRRKDNLADMGELLNDVGCRYRTRVMAIHDSLAVIEEQTRAVHDRIRRGEDAVALRQAAEEITNSVKNVEGGLSGLIT